jgi:tetratricopeptide (TPR) repeat protein
VYLAKGDCLYEMGRIKDALYFYREILTRFSDPEFKRILDEAHYGLAWCYLKLGEFKNAIDEFKKTLKFTDNPIVRISSQIQIADAYQEKEMYDLALETYNNILKEYPDNIYSDYIQFQIGMLFIKNNRLEEAKLSFKNLEKSFPNSKLIPESKYYLATSYFTQGDYQKAMGILQKFLEDYPAHSFRDRVRYLYGKCYFNQGNYSKTLEIFDTLSRDITDKKLQQLVLIDKAYIHINLKEYAQAKEAFKDFIRKFPYSEYLPSVLLNLGNLYEQENEFDEARGYYQQILKDYPHTPTYYEAMMSLAHLSWRTNDLEKAKFYLTKLIESNKDKIVEKAMLSLADIYAQEDNPQDALKIYDNLIKDDSAISPKVMAKKGFLLKQLKDYEKAVYWFRQALAGQSEDPKIHLALGYCLEKLGKDSDAINDYFKIIYLYDDVEYKVKAYFRIAHIYEKQNKLNESKEIYNKIIGLNVEESKIAQAKIEEIERSLNAGKD